ncbi:MAG: hypothetical protein WAM52_17605 [Steroidobacteraceae bacterium]
MVLATEVGKLTRQKDVIPLAGDSSRAEILSRNVLARRIFTTLQKPDSDYTQKPDAIEFDKMIATH